MAVAIAAGIIKRIVVPIGYQDHHSVKIEIFFHDAAGRPYQFVFAHDAGRGPSNFSQHAKLFKLVVQPFGHFVKGRRQLFKFVSAVNCYPASKITIGNLLGPLFKFSQRCQTFAYIIGAEKKYDQYG